MKWLRILPILPLLFVSVTHASVVPAENFVSGVEMIQRGEGSVAVELLSREKDVDAALLYNIAVAAELVGEKGWARLMYRRAERMWPLFVNRKALVERLYGDDAGFTAFFFSALRSVSPAAVQWMILMLLFLAAIFSIFGAGTLRRISLFLLVLPAGVALFHFMDGGGKRAVVVIDSEARAGPGDAFGTVARVQKGSEGVILGRVGGYTLMKLRDGIRGWMQEGAVKLVGLAPRDITVDDIREAAKNWKRSKIE